MEGTSKSGSELPEFVKKWLPSLKSPEYVGVPKNMWVDMGKPKKGSSYELCCKLCNQKSNTLKEAVIHLKEKHKDKKPYKDCCIKCSPDRFRLTCAKFSHCPVNIFNIFL